MLKDLPELKKIRTLAQLADKSLVKTNELARVDIKNKSYPIISFEIGTDDVEAPVLGLFGGVHGLEKVGTHVVVSYLQSLFRQMKWDDDLRAQLNSSRIVAIPLLNPGGMATNRRANPKGIDLMRNAPIEADGKNLPLLIGGHRISNRLPWYRGKKGDEMELEAQTLVSFVKEKIFPSTTALTVDFHSGFGMIDRFWYPYAKTSSQFPNIKDVQGLKDLLDETLHHHIYSIEPQSYSYTTHGDLWDFLYDQHFQENIRNGHKVFIPWTLEMGSWNWIKKNPKQIFSSLGLFNPIIEHRHDRTMRRHQALVEFLFRAVRNPIWRAL
ncbi:MAG: M14 family zinc carboxypeptidase [Bdellovibrionota bacterium]